MNYLSRLAFDRALRWLARPWRPRVSLLTRGRHSHDGHTMATRRRAHDPLDASLFKAMPGWVRPMLATPADIAPDGPQWLHEVKQDGHQLQIVVTDGTITLRSRIGQDV